MPKKITYEQKLFLEMARISSFNNYNGEHVVGCLLAEDHLWEGMMFGRGSMQGIILRDIGIDYGVNADTMWLTPAEGREDDLEGLVRSEFGADEIDWIGGQAAATFLGAWTAKDSDEDRVVLRVWWD